MSDTDRAIKDIRDGLAAQNRALVTLIKSQETVAKIQIELLQQILTAVTKPIPPSPIPDLMEKLIGLVGAQSDALDRQTDLLVKIDETTIRIDDKLPGGA